MSEPELRFCRICLISNIKMHRILGTEVQDVFEKLSNMQVQDNGSYSVCYLCYWQLKKCQQLVIKSQTSEELLKQIWVIHKQLNVKSICSVDRLSHGLVNSLKNSKTESLQIPQFHLDIKSEDETEINAYEFMIKDEPEDDWTHTTENCRGPDEKQNFIQNKVKYIENISGTQKNTFAEVDKLSKIVNAPMISKRESPKIPNHQNIKSAEPKVSNFYEVVIKVEPNDDGTFTTEQCCETDAKQNFTQDNAKCIENISETQKNTCAENNELLKILCKTSKQVSVKNNKKSFICNDCGTMFDTKDLIIKHISEHNCHKNMNVKDKPTHTAEKRFKCAHCDYATGKNHNFKTHMRRHTGEKPFKCEYCNYACKVKCNLKKHIAGVHTRIMTFKCEHCDYKSTDKYILNTHIRTHTGEKPFKCENCSHEYSSAASLKYHIATHIEKPFKCKYCDHKFASGGDLKKHIRTHTGEKPFKCTYCNYSCTTNPALKIHIRTHTGEKPFKCEHCDYTSSTKYGVKKHSRTHTGDKPHKCEFCDYTCTKATYLKKHIRKHTR